MAIVEENERLAYQDTKIHKKPGEPKGNQELGHIIPKYAEAKKWFLSVKGTNFK